jgi:hypothetical protein
MLSGFAPDMIACGVNRAGLESAFTYRIQTDNELGLGSFAILPLAAVCHHESLSCKTYSVFFRAIILATGFVTRFRIFLAWADLFFLSFFPRSCQ